LRDVAVYARSSAATSKAAATARRAPDGMLRDSEGEEKELNRLEKRTRGCNARTSGVLS
jgi:hypothetical protein